MFRSPYNFIARIKRGNLLHSYASSLICVIVQPIYMHIEFSQVKVMQKITNSRKSPIKGDYIFASRGCRLRVSELEIDYTRGRRGARQAANKSHLGQKCISGRAHCADEGLPKTCQAFPLCNEAASSYAPRAFSPSEFLRRSGVFLPATRKFDMEKFLII